MRRIISMFKVALISILRNRMRSLLTSLGIIIGVAAVIVMVAVGEGSQSQIADSINKLGSNMLVVSPGSNNRSSVSSGAGTYNKITFDDVEMLKEQGTTFSTVTPIVKSRAQLIGGIGNWQTEAYGVTTDFFELRNWETTYGEIFTDKDIKTKRKVALLGKTVADLLFPDQDPTGKMIRIEKVPVKIIGVLEEKGQTGIGQDQDDIVILPATTVLYRLKGRRKLDMIQIGANSAEEIALAEEEIASIMRVAHKLPESGNSDDFEVKNMEEITAMATSSSKVMTMLLAAIASVSLLVGGIGIMNIMLVSVTERTREIGIRISIGARPSDIMLQFILEAVLLSVFGGVIGVLSALGVLYVMDHYFSIAVSINSLVILGSVGFSATVGIFFGLYPAKRAASLNPIEALRTE